MSEYLGDIRCRKNQQTENFVIIQVACTNFSESSVLISFIDDITRTRLFKYIENFTYKS